ncbi:MAG TPA: Gfo/Idh/MocA family oxidoreductase [Candidatus Acidoferrales bacterium]|nr:Gfo/Idh/MocA family oxidoreductase [Candidatus Acidoferrales bacterium]
MPFDVSRRHFFFGSLLAGVYPARGFSSSGSLKALGYKSPNEKLNIASIGAGGKAASDIRGCAATENIVALCDVNDNHAASIFKQFEKATKYRDFRQMLDKESGTVDAVIVTVPDFMHGTAAMHCMERGKHVYVQKPLVRTIFEARMLRDAANKYKVATQMGNQGYSNEGTRQCAEMVWAGEIGDVTEVHAWTDRPIWPQGLTSVPAETPVPPHLDWDLWLGIAEKRPYTSGGEGYPAGFARGGFYEPANWRGFYDFGCGALGDMACHIFGAPNLALKLGERQVKSVECVKKDGVSNFMFPTSSTIKFEFAALGNMPAVTLYWYDGLKEQPKVPGVPEGEYLGDLPSLGGGRGMGGGRGAGGGRGQGGPEAAGAPQAPVGTAPGGQGRAGFALEQGQATGFVGRVFQWNDAYLPTAERRRVTPDGSLFVGRKGMITTGTYGEQTRLVPVERMRDYHFPSPLLTRSPGGRDSHYRDWIRACKGGDPACSNFNVASPFVEWMLLGVIALRVEGKIEYDPTKMRITNNAEANKYIRPFVRKGWSLT